MPAHYDSGMPGTAMKRNAPVVPTLLALSAAVARAAWTTFVQKKHSLGSDACRNIKNHVARALWLEARAWHTNRVHLAQSVLTTKVSIVEHFVKIPLRVTKHRRNVQVARIELENDAKSALRHATYRNSWHAVCFCFPRVLSLLRSAHVCKTRAC